MRLLDIVSPRSRDSLALLCSEGPPERALTPPPMAEQPSNAGEQAQDDFAVDLADMSEFSLSSLHATVHQTIQTLSERGSQAAKPLR